MVSTIENTLAFTPEVRVVIHNANTVELRVGVWNCSSITLADDEQRGILGKIVLGLQRGRPVPAIAQEVGVEDEAVNSVIEVLVANNLMIARESLKQWTPLTYLVMPTLGAARGMATLPQQVILLGPEVMTQFFTRITLHSPVTGAIHVEDEATLAALTRKDLQLEADGLALADAVEPYSRWKDALVVAVSSELNPIFLSNLNFLAHRVGFRFLPAAVDGPFAIVGPTVTPGSTACFACAETRVLESLRDHTLYVEYRKALAEDQVYGSTEMSMDPFQATILSLASWEVVNLMSVGNSFTTNKILSIYAPTMEVVFHELLRMPGCRVCSTRGALDQPLYSDLQSYLSSQLGKREKK